MLHYEAGGWVVTNVDGYSFYVQDVRRTRSEAIKAAVELSGHPWKWLRKSGCRAIRVTVSNKPL